MSLIGIFAVSRSLAARWKAGILHKEWADTYPSLFDADDIRLARGQGRLGYHFIEWYAAIFLHKLTGYYSLVSKYQYGNHRRKREIVARLGLTGILRKQPAFKGTQAPDLLMYAPDLNGFFLCEVKGPGDTIKPLQARYFEYLERQIGQPVRLIRFKWRSAGRRSGW